jgi:carboxyl-terminal processing protease
MITTMRKKFLILAVVATAGFSLLAFRAFSPQDKDEVLMKLVLQGLNSNHYAPYDLNDDFSKRVWKSYLERLDYNKRFFTASDISQLQSYENQIDDQVKESDYGFFNQAEDLYAARYNQVKSYYKEMLIQPFDFNENETVELDPEKMTWAANESELKDRWRKLLKWQVLSRVVTELELQESGKAKGEIKTLDQLEEEIRVKVMKTYDDWAHRMDKLDRTDHRDAFLNAIAATYDPHTGYFPPDDKENFDIQMSGKLEGIGATLLEKEGYIEVSKIVPGSASYRQGELEEGDVILKVAQAANEPVDIVDMRLDDAVKLIRGPKGSEVRLTVRKVDGNTKQISIIRDVVILEETFAKSAIIKDKAMPEGYGYIKLPKFYADFSDRTGRNCATDVADEIEKLKRQKIKGLVIDLRNNGGGSLMDVVKMAGLFIDQGPIVQVRSRNGSPQILADTDPKVQYDGPLVIMVNTSSASASEILAAAIQDYRRGIIVGSATYGKGTVQRFFDLDNFIQGNPEEIKPLGSIKLTTQKFYRINGGATQLKGVTPDVLLSDAYTYIDRGEREQDFTMPWDEISPVDYKTWKLSPADIARVRKDSRERTQGDPIFSVVEENAQRMKRQRDLKVRSLQIDTYRADEKRFKEEADKYKDIFKPIPEMTISALPEDIAALGQDTIRIKLNNEWIEALGKDSYLHEVSSVLKAIQ